MDIREYTEYRESEIRPLYEAVGWRAYTGDMPALKRGFENSLMVLAAYENRDLIGILRAVGDGETIVFIQDILVLPEKQRQGVGTALLREALRRYKNVRQIQLTADNTPEAQAFYGSLGFRELSRIGCCGFMKIG